MTTRCCIAGGGPAGMMLGFLLSRAGIDVVVLEKHADFLRDFRGDTVHPSTLEVMHELGLLEDFLRRPHQQVSVLSGQIGGERVVLADFSHLPAHARFIALMPQWDFLQFLASHAKETPRFRLLMQAQVEDLLRQGERVVGVRVQTPAGPLEIRSDLVVGADGRHSTVREKAGLSVQDFGAPIDVLWMRISRRADDNTQALGYLSSGHVLVLLDRGDYWQCAFVIPKGGHEALKARGLESLREEVAEIVPFLRDRLGELRSWDDVKLLTVVIDRLRSWSSPGLLCIGDAAHAMSPIGGVGINLAIQDAVATANLLVGPLRAGPPTLKDLQRVQRRREWPTAVVQRLQVLVQNRLFGPALRGTVKVPAFARLLQRWPRLRRLPARLVGMGVRPEHVSPALAPPR